MLAACPVLSLLPFTAHTTTGCSGSFLANLWPHNDEWESCSGFGLQLFDLARRKWLSPVEAAPYGGGDDPEAARYPPPRFAADDSAGAVVITRLEDTTCGEQDADGLIIFSVQQPAVTSFKLAQIFDAQWLSGRSLLVPGGSELVKLELTAALGMRPSSQVAAAGERLALVPGSSSALVLRTEVAKPCISLTFTLYDTASLAVGSSWEHSIVSEESLPGEGRCEWYGRGRGFDVPVHCSVRAVAVCVASRTLLFSYEGACFASLPGMSEVSFSGDGLFLSGVAESVACIWDARTGALAVKLPPVRAGAQLRSVTWSGWDRLHVVSMEKLAQQSEWGTQEELVLRVLQPKQDGARWTLTALQK